METQFSSVPSFAGKVTPPTEPVKATLMDPKSLYVPEDFKAHWAPELDHEGYHADKSAVGSSSLVLMLSSPKTFYQGHVLGKKKTPTREMKLGTIVHMALLEGEKFRSKYVVQPVFTGYTKDGKPTTSANAKDVQEKKAKWESELPKGTIVVTEEELEMITGMIESVSEHDQGRHVFTGGIPECPGYYRDPRTGIKMKIMPDFRAHDNFMLTDFKTAVSVDQRLFGSKAFSDWRYDLRLWMYAYGTSIIENKPMPQNLFFMGVERVWPFESAVFFMTDEQKNQAQYDYNRAMDKLKECIDSGKWPMRQTKMEPLWTPKKFIDADVHFHEKELEDAESRN